MAVKTFMQVPSICLNSLKDRQDDEICIVKGMGNAKVKNTVDFSSKEDVSWAVYVKFFESQATEMTCDIFVFDLTNKQLVTVVLNVVYTTTRIESLRQALNMPFANPQSAIVTQSQSTVAAQTQPTIDVPPGLSEVSQSVQAHVLPTQIPDSSTDNCMPSQATNLPDLTAALYDLLVRVADVDSGALCHDIAIADLGIDSLMSMEVTEEINKQFSINVGTADVATALDVKSLCRWIADNTSDYYYDSNGGSRTPSDFQDLADRVWTPTSAMSDTDDSSVDEDGGLISIDKSTEGVLRAFDKIRNEFDVFAKITGCDQFWSRIYPVQAKLITSYIVEAFAKLGCDLSFLQQGEKVPSISHVSQHNQLTAHLVHILGEYGFVTKSDNEWIRTLKPLSGQPTSSEKLTQILAEFPQFAPEHKLLDVAGSKLYEVLSGKVNPISLLFGSPEKRQLMADQYSVAPIQSSVSQQLCSFIKQCFGSRTSQTPIKVLEIGGGTCGTTLYAVETFAKLGVSVEYTFTDISSSFVSAAKSKLSKYNFIKYRTLDIVEDPESDFKGQYDMVIATNVIHAIPDVCKSAENIRKMLSPGGFLTLVEYTHDLFLLDIIFGQLEGWWCFADGRTHATMHASEWQTRLQRAGFGHVDWTGGQTRESEIMRIILAC